MRDDDEGEERREGGRESDERGDEERVRERGGEGD